MNYRRVQIGLEDSLSWAKPSASEEDSEGSALVTHQNLGDSS